MIHTCTRSCCRGDLAVWGLTAAWRPYMRRRSPLGAVLGRSGELNDAGRSLNLSSTSIATIDSDVKTNLRITMLNGHAMIWSQYCGIYFTVLSYRTERKMDARYVVLLPLKSLSVTVDSLNTLDSPLTFLQVINIKRYVLYITFRICLNFWEIHTACCILVAT